MAADQPERLDHFMARANAAYYAQHDPFADFTTAPEIGQVFGELLGAWAAITWQQMGSPHPLLLAEAGPGRGTLMADARRLIRRVAPGFHAACQLHLIETSPRLRALQAQNLPDATWHTALETLPDGPLILLANEFLDALPVRQFERTATGWAERHVAQGEFTLLPAEPPLPNLPANAAEGAVFELQPAAQEFVHALAARIARHGGAALLLDYGRAETACADSLQAVRDRAPAPPLDAPGEADLTVHVDFQAMAEAARAAGAVPWGPLAQGSLLARLGLIERIEQLAAHNPGRATALRDAASRLAAPARMGQLFKALAITRNGAPPPPGFEA